MTDRRYFVDVFGDIVDAMRATGTITASSEVSGTYTLTSVNSFNAFESVKIDSIDYLIVSATSTEFVIEAATGLDFTGETWQALAPYYIYGHPLEVANRLSIKGKNPKDKFKKYPLIVLYQDFVEDHGDNTIFEYTVSPFVVIVNSTDKTYISEQRYENIFKPILYPLYYNLIDKISKSPDIYENIKKKIEHNKTDRLFWGAASNYGNTGLIFNDNLDAIELEFDSLNINKVINTCL